MSAARMITSLLGAMGGGRLGRMVGGPVGGMIGSLAGSMLMGRGLGGGRGGGGGLGGLLGGLMGGDDDKVTEAAATMSDDDAIVLLQAMTNAAKADGQVDEAEIKAIIDRAGDLDAEEQQLLRDEFSKPLDLDAFVQSVPSGMERDVYVASLIPIEVDTASEVDYLNKLAAGLGIPRAEVDEMNKAFGM